MTVHEFEPTEFHTTFRVREPALRIADGDTVITTTLDAGGGDSAGRQVHSGSNPQTGPFWVEGAEPGDTLAVTLVRLRPNRDTGYTNTVAAANVVDPAFVADLPRSRRATWRFDPDRTTATLVEPSTALGELTVELCPMLGCLGVAPAMGRALDTATSGAHGGNMDYRGYVAGLTAHFPVFEPGALFSLGDGHAVQGAGEIVGTGIETSFDVEFSVRVVKDRPISWPRGEDDEFIFTAGNARPLDQALQHATTEMLRWLAADYGLDAEAASILLGQCVDYDVGNVFDPAYTMICKLAKRHLPTPGGRGVKGGAGGDRR